MKIELINIEEIKPYKNNAKKHDIAGIKKSIEEFGFNIPLQIDRGNIIIAGHGRFYAAKELGLMQLPVVYIDHLSDEQKKAFRIADNKLNLNAGFDIDILKNELESMNEMSFTSLGFDPLEIENLFSREIVSSREDDFQKEVNAIKDNEVKMPIVPEFTETYECFVIIIKNEIDELFVRNTFNLEKVQGNEKGLSNRKSNVITVDQIRAMLCSQ